MHILHLAGAYGGSEVYKSLYSAIDRLGIRQTVFVPLNAANHHHIGNNPVDFKTQGSKIIYSTILSQHHRALYGLKIKKILSEVKKCVNLDEIDLIHCANLCADGGVAYEIKKQFNIPYISAVRNTDLFAYYKYFFWRRKYFNRVLDNASRCIFLSPKHREFMHTRYHKQDSENSIVIPNGIDNYYFENSPATQKSLTDKIRLIFAASYSKGKSLREIIEAIAIVRERTKLDLVLDAVGDGLPFRKTSPKYAKEIYELGKKYNWLTLSKYIPKIELAERYRNSDIFIMPSKPETFGLVYVEALTQGLPIIYGKGQGFDGYFDEGVVGYHAEAFDISDIANAIESVIANYTKLTHNISQLNLQASFNWDKIASEYLNIYNDTIRNKQSNENKTKTHL